VKHKRVSDPEFQSERQQPMLASISICAAVVISGVTLRYVTLRYVTWHDVAYVSTPKNRPLDLSSSISVRHCRGLSSTPTISCDISDNSSSSLRASYRASSVFSVRQRRSLSLFWKLRSSLGPTYSAISRPWRGQQSGRSFC